MVPYISHGVQPVTEWVVPVSCPLPEALANRPVPPVSANASPQTTLPSAMSSPVPPALRAPELVAVGRDEGQVSVTVVEGNRGRGHVHVHPRAVLEPARDPAVMGDLTGGCESYDVVRGDGATAVERAALHGKAGFRYLIDDVPPPATVDGDGTLDPWLTALKIDPAFDRLRSEPRFVDLMDRVGLW